MKKYLVLIVLAFLIFGLSACEEKYTITYLNWNGEVVYEDSASPGSDLSNYEVLVIPEKEGYAFIGWDIDLPTSMPNKDIILYAQFMKGYDSFDQINTFEAALSQDEEEYLVYFYSEGCNYCDEIEITVLAFADENDADIKVYFADVASIKGNNTIPNLTGTPGIVRVRNGIVVDVQTGTVPILSLFDSINAEAE